MTKLALMALATELVAQDLIRADMPQLPPDRLSVDKDSPYFDDCYTRVGVRLNGIERQGDVQEYCVSEGWVTVRHRNRMTGAFTIHPKTGKYVVTTVPGNVVAYFKDGRPTRTGAAAYTEPQSDHQGALAAAEVKRQRRAAKRARDAGMGE